MEMPYQNCQVALLTKHGKQNLLKPILESDIGCRLLHTENFDTDKLGTFTRDIDRQGSQLDAARRKAQLAMELTGVEIAIASEGAFGHDPFTGFIAWNTEILLWVDKVRELEIIGLAHGPAQSIQRKVKTLAELKEFINEARFPDHHLVVRPEDHEHTSIYKNIRNIQELTEAFDSAMKLSSNGMVFVENDLRAFSNPTRQEVIKNAAKDLTQKLKSFCPQCHKPGFWRTRRIPGLPCSFCLSRTQVAIAEVWGCISCAYESQVKIQKTQFADPSKCNFCNP